MKNIRHFSIDNETLDTVATAHLLSIGIACEYDGKTHSMIVYPSWECQENFWRTQSQDTLDWWGKQDPNLKGATFEAAKNSVMSSGKCIKQINQFILEHSKDADEIRVWGNGSEFDIAQLEHLSRQTGIETIWGYHQAQSQRTIQDIAQLMSIEYNKADFFDGQAHDAEADARAQVRLINHLWSAIRDKTILSV